MENNSCPICGSKQSVFPCSTCGFEHNWDDIEFLKEIDEKLYFEMKESSISRYRSKWWENSGFEITTYSEIQLDEYKGAADTVVIPFGVKKIWGFRYFLEGDSTTKRVIIPDTVTHINNFAFINCTKLESIELPPVLRELGIATFESCSSLKSCSIPTGITVISERLFHKCTKLRKVTFAGLIYKISESAFSDCGSLGKIELPDTVEEIGASAFCGCRSIRKINVPESILRIEENTFSFCDNLEKVNLDEVFLKNI